MIRVMSCIIIHDPGYYTRRATNTINYGTALPLAQGVTFPVES
jgi:hypothetical protein